jgi:hypothetical protein
MPVPMVKVWIVRVLMPHRFMTVPMGMRFCDRAIVDMLMMLVVDMGMIVLQHLMVMVMVMFVVVPFSKVQP